MSGPVSLAALDPEQLAAIRSLHLRARMIVEGSIAGMHRSPYHGFSAEFLEYRPYQAGESVRMVDWRKYAKTDRFVVRSHQDETNLIAHILFDKSASMAFKSTAPFSKYDYGRTLAAAVAWILLGQRDSVGFAAFDSHICSALPPRSMHSQLSTIIAQLERLELSGTTGCGTALDQIGAGLRKRGLCILVSDLFDTIESLKRGLCHLRFKRQDVLIVRVLDVQEAQFSHDGPLRIIDLETGERLELDGSVAERAFRSGFEHHSAQVEDLCRDLGIELCTVRTDEPFQKALHRVLVRRSRLN